MSVENVPFWGKSLFFCGKGSFGRDNSLTKLKSFPKGMHEIVATKCLFTRRCEPFPLKMRSKVQRKKSPVLGLSVYCCQWRCCAGGRVGRAVIMNLVALFDVKPPAFCCNVRHATGADTTTATLTKVCDFQRVWISLQYFKETSQPSLTSFRLETPKLFL